MGLFKFISGKRDTARRKEVERARRFAQFGKFVGNFAHDVNNPLMVISGRVQLALMEDIQNEELKKNLKVIYDESQRAKDIVNRALNSVRPAKAQLKPGDINKILEESVSFIERQFLADNVKIVKSCGAGLPRVNVNAKDMQEVFINLLNNSRDAMLKGGQIKVSTCRSGGSVKITFQDPGCGMTAEVMGKLFEPFFTTKEKGAGLGLAVSYSIIKAHGGELNLESSPGKGTSASILLPVMPEGGNNA